jgi:hypothetical protein
MFLTDYKLLNIFVQTKFKFFTMKKILAITALGVLSLTSCKKDYTCECTTTASGLSATVTTTIKDTKKNAEDACSAKNATANGATTTCSIK